MHYCNPMCRRCGWKELEGAWIYMVEYAQKAHFYKPDKFNFEEWKQNDPDGQAFLILRGLAAEIKPSFDGLLGQ